MLYSNGDTRGTAMRSPWQPSRHHHDNTHDIDVTTALTSHWKQTLKHCDDSHDITLTTAIKTLWQPPFHRHDNSHDTVTTAMISLWQQPWHHQVCGVKRCNRPTEESGSIHYFSEIYVNVNPILFFPLSYSSVECGRFFAFVCLDHIQTQTSNTSLYLSSFVL